MSMCEVADRQTSQGVKQVGVAGDELIEDVGYKASSAGSVGSTPGPQVPALIGELRSCMAHGPAKNKCMYAYVYPLEPPSHCLRSTSLGHHRGAELPLLYNSFPLAICFTHGGVYMSMPLSQFIPPSPSPLCLHVNLHCSKEETLFK